MNDKTYERVVAGSGRGVMSLVEALDAENLGAGFMAALDVAKAHPDWFAAMVRQFQGPATLNAGVRLQLDMLVRVFPADPDEQSEWPEDLRVREWPS